MFSSKSTDWWVLIGNIGIFLGLVLVGYQIKQTNDIARAEMISQGAGFGMDIDLAMIGEGGSLALSKVNYQADELSDEEIAVLNHIHRAYITVAIHVTNMREIGMSKIPESVQADDLAFLMNSHFGRMYWEESKQFLPFPESFVSEVDRSLSGRDPTVSRVDGYRRELERRELQAPSVP